MLVPCARLIIDWLDPNLFSESRFANFIKVWSVLTLVIQVDRPLSILYFYTDPALRPVLIIGPLSECVVTKLLQEFPGQFTRCLAEAMHCSQSTLEQGLRDALYVDYRKKGSYFECTTVQAVKDICEKVRYFFYPMPYIILITLFILNV